MEYHFGNLQRMSQMSKRPKMHNEWIDQAQDYGADLLQCDTMD